MAANLNCYALEQAAKHSLATRYGVACNREKYFEELVSAAGLIALSSLSSCVPPNEAISCFMKGKTVDPCSTIEIKDCSGIVVAWVDPEPKPCYLNAQFIN